MEFLLPLKGTKIVKVKTDLEPETPEDMSRKEAIPTAHVHRIWHQRHLQKTKLYGHVQHTATAISITQNTAN